MLKIYGELTVWKIYIAIVLLMCTSLGIWEVIRDELGKCVFACGVLAYVT